MVPPRPASAPRRATTIAIDPTTAIPVPMAPGTVRNGLPPEIWSQPVDGGQSAGSLLISIWYKPWTATGCAARSTVPVQVLSVVKAGCGTSTLVGQNHAAMWS